MATLALVSESPRAPPGRAADHRRGRAAGRPEPGQAGAPLSDPHHPGTHPDRARPARRGQIHARHRQADQRGTRRSAGTCPTTRWSAPSSASSPGNGMTRSPRSRRASELADETGESLQPHPAPRRAVADQPAPQRPQPRQRGRRAAARDQLAEPAPATARPGPRGRTPLLLEAERRARDGARDPGRAGTVCAQLGLALEYPAFGADLVRLALAAGESGRARDVPRRRSPRWRQQRGALADRRRAALPGTGGE